MRRRLAILAQLALAVLLAAPDAARAACVCSCANGVARNVCERETDVQVLCMRLCPNIVRPQGGGDGGGSAGLVAPAFSSSGAAAASSDDRTRER